MKKIIFLAMLVMSVISFGINKNGEFDRIREKWKRIIINIPEEINEQDRQEMKNNAMLLKKSTEKVLEKVNNEENGKFLFNDLKDMKNGVHIKNSFENIKTLGKAYLTPGTEYYKNEDLKKTITKSLEWINKNAYNESVSELGNWWQWEIGIPKVINEIGIIMYGEISSELLNNLMNASKYFQPYATHSGASPAAKYSTSPNKRVSKGGNRMDTAIISFGRGILTKDRAETMNGVEAVGEVGEIVSQGDGFYEDGSFIQHENVAYNGTYASVLFNGLGTLLYVSENTEFFPNDSRLKNLYDSIVKGYTYLLINGGINDSVSGRAISRDNSDNLERGRALIASLGMISEGVGEPYREKIQKFIKKTVAENNRYDAVSKTGNLVIKNILRKIMENKNIKIEEIAGTKIFSSMDRAVQINRRKGKVIISMHSSRIANYETMNGENLKGWYTGDGMTYIYGIDSSAFTDYWHTVDKLHLPGTTESVGSRGAGSGERRLPAAVSSKAWTGGATNGEIAMIGMDFISWNNRTEAKKSWFMLGEEIIAVGSDISSSDGEIHTTVDNRILHDKNNRRITVNGETVTDMKKIYGKKGTYVNFTNIETKENIGYKILNAPILTLTVKDEKGSWKEIGGKSENMDEKTYFKMYMEHGKNPEKSKYAYIILPMFTEEEVERYDENNIKIIRADNNVHAIEDKRRKITGMNFWKNKEVKINDIKVFSPLSIIKIREENGMSLVLSDPTQLSNYETEIELDGEYELLSKNSDIKINTNKGKTRLKINLANKGKSVIINLKNKK